MPANQDFQRRLESIEELLRRIETAADPAIRACAKELVELLMDLHGAGLERTLELIGMAGETGQGIVERLGRDPLVASLLILYGLHPMQLEDRVKQGLDKARSNLRTRGGEVDLLSIEDGSVRLRLHADGHGCGSTPQALKEIVEQAIYDAAPDVTALVIEGGGDQPNFFPLEMLRDARPTPAASKGSV